MLASDITGRIKTLFGDSNGIIVTDAMILQWIADAEAEIARETQWNIYNDTADAQDYQNGYYITELILISRVRYDFTPLALIDNETLDRLSLTETPAGIPKAYYTIGESIYLFPAPVAGDLTQVRVQYVALPGVPGAVEDPLNTPDRYRNDVVNYCISKAHERNENFRAAEMYWTRFMAGVAQRRFESLTADDSFTVVGPDYEDVAYQNEIVF